MGKFVVIYDTRTGNTEKMAECIAEGAASINNINVVVKKIGDAFTLRTLADADVIVLGSPAHYSYVTLLMRDFLSCLRSAVKDDRLNLKDKLAGAFGSYGWDGGITIERLANVIKNLGFKTPVAMLAQPHTSNSKLNDAFYTQCRDFGRTLAKN